jgi:hypothetical protein
MMRDDWRRLNERKEIARARTEGVADRGAERIACEARGAVALRGAGLARLGTGVARRECERRDESGATDGEGVLSHRRIREEVLASGR